LVSEAKEPRTATLRGAAAALFLSGVAALVYQVLWARELSLVLGSTVAAVTTVLATFMAGLGLGSALAARTVDRLRPALLPRLYAGLELGIALFALALPLLLGAATPIYSFFYRSAEALPALLPAARVLVSALFLLVPTSLMGATLPTLSAAVIGKAVGMGRPAGFLYASNTLGAVLGSLGAGIALLPLLGVSQTVLLAAALNLLAGAVALFWVQPHEAETIEKAPKSKKSRPRDARPKGESLRPAVLLTVIALSGLGALGNEVAWTRALVLLIGPTPYGFAFVVTAVIAGIALGSAVASGWADRTARPASLLAAIEIGAGLACLVVARVIGSLAVPVGELVIENADRMGRLMALELLWVFLLLLAPSFLFGAAFPLAVRVFSEREPQPGAAVGRTYAWNTVGAIAGALLGGFLALPALGLESTLYTAASIHGAAGALVLLANSGRRRAAMAAVGLAPFVLVPLVVRPWDLELLSGGVYKYAAYAQKGELIEILRRGELVYYREGRTATVSVKQVGGKLSLAIDGKVDATNAGDMLTQRLLAHVPLLLHAQPRVIAVIGLGSGVTAGSALAHPVERVDAVEISAEVVEAARLFKEANRNALADSRLRLVLGDGRNHLLLSRERYDVVISEPSNPWMAGVSALFTRDFFQLARSRLEPGGLFCQWVHIYNMSPRDLKTVVGSFIDAFPAVQLFLVNEGDALLIGSEVFPEVSAEELRSRMERADVRQDLAGVEVKNAYTLAMLYALRTPELARWAGEARRHTDDRPVLDFSAPRFIHANTSRENREAISSAARDLPLPEPYATLRASPTVELVSSRAMMLEKSESFEWAVEAYRQSLSLSPRLLAAQEGLVRAAISAGQPQLAESELLRLAEGRAPVEARVALGFLYNNLDRPKEALAQLQEALQRDPAHRRGLLLAAEILGEQGQVDSMEALARQALAAAPEDAEALGFLTEASLRRGDLQQALGRAEDVLARHPQATRALEVAAIARAQTGDRRGARAAFERLVSLEPEAWVHLNNFALFELQENDYAAAARLYERAVDVNPKNVAGFEGLLEAARLLKDRQRIERAQAGLAFLGRRSGR
jgi:spermidine synthase